MKISEYIKDKAFTLLISFISFVIIIFLLFFLDAHLLLKIMIPFVLIVTYLICLIRDYCKRNTFYKHFNKVLSELDKKYLITEIIIKSPFYEGNLFMEYLYEINKSYNEELNKYKYSFNEFKEYIELWCHEIKTPIATAKLTIENETNNSNINEELEKIENYIEQVLYYARSEVVEKDYFINKINLKDIVNNCIKKNKKDLIFKKIKITNFNEDILIESDPKWLEFIINQVIANSIKYAKNKNAKIEFSYIINQNSIFLNINDNGIGIKDEDISKVFNKGFTGSNGRKKYNSTGIGLYLSQKLCTKLGHNISIMSKENMYTKITIIFPINSMTNNKIFF